MKCFKFFHAGECRWRGRFYALKRLVNHRISDVTDVVEFIEISEVLDFDALKFLKALIHKNA
jgi:hypothetical protein